MHFNIRNRLFSLLLTFAMLFALFPTSALAANAAAVEDTWDGTSNTSWYNDSETEFTLTTAEELAGLATLVNAGNTFERKTVYLGGNINLSGFEWTSIGIAGQGWRGIFDGQYYQISNLKTRKTDNDPGQGLFHYITSGTVENLSVVDADIKSSSGNFNMGILADWTNGSVTIRNCHTSGTIHNKTGKKLLGGVIGSAKAGAQIIGCSSDAEIISEYEENSGDTVGGIVGQWEDATDAALISDCWFGGSISCGFRDSGVGGILGANFDFFDNQPGVDIQNCLVATREIRCAEPGNITWIGAVVDGQVTNCLWPDSPPSDVVLDPDIYSDYNGNYLAVVKMVVDWDAGTAGPDPTFDPTACGQAVAEFDTAEVLTTLQSNAGENIHWVAGKEHPVFQYQAAIEAINAAISQMEDWTVKEEAANTGDAIKPILEQRLSEMQLDSYTVTVDSVTQAASGTDGSFDFTVQLKKDGVSRLAKVTSCIIDATPLPQVAPAAPTEKSKTYNSVTLETVADNANGAKAEYSKDNGATWQASPEFTGLSPSTKYTFVVRYGAVGNCAASPASPAVEITTPAAPSGGGGGYTPPRKPSVSVDGEGGKATSDRDGTVTITPDEGYQIGTITVNGKEVEIPADGKLTGLKPSDKVVVTFAKISEKWFIDVPLDAWFYGAVKYVVDHGLFYGTSDITFSPNGTMTRGMLVTVLHRMEDEPKADPADFLDVESGKYYSEAVAWAAAKGIVEGYGNGNFGPEDAITREQLAAILYRCSGSPASAGTLTGFTDADKASGYALDALRWAVEQSIIQGKGGGILDPTGKATRAEVAAMLQRFCEKAGR